MQDNIQRVLEWFWDLIDISENLGRATRMLEKQPGGFTFNVIHAIGYGVMTLVFANLAWVFDIQSTWNALEITRNFAGGGAQQFPAALASLSLGNLALLAITLAPTFTEIFGAAFAKAQIGLAQAIIVALSIFDVVTDIPTVTLYLQAHGPYFDTLGIFGWPTYFVAFVGWLFLSTFGFELFTILLAWATIASVLKALDGKRGQQVRR